MSRCAGRTDRCQSLLAAFAGARTLARLHAIRVQMRRRAVVLVVEAHCRWAQVVCEAAMAPYAVVGGRAGTPQQQNSDDPRTHAGQLGKSLRGDRDTKTACKYEKNEEQTLPINLHNYRHKTSSETQHIARAVANKVGRALKINPPMKARSASSEVPLQRQKQNQKGNRMAVSPPSNIHLDRKLQPPITDARQQKQKDGQTICSSIVTNAIQKSKGIASSNQLFIPCSSSPTSTELSIKIVCKFWYCFHSCIRSYIRDKRKNSKIRCFYAVITDLDIIMAL